MSGLSDTDWEALSAYHDGEMASEEVRSFERRLRDEPELAATLASIRSQSHNLRMLGPQRAEEPPAPRHTPRRGWVAAGMLAASLAVAAYTGVMSRQSVPLIELHDAFSAQSFPIAQGDLQPVMQKEYGALPDLIPAGLTLVATRNIPEGTAAHYAGKNGCRLTLYLGSEPFALPSDPEIEATAWEASGKSYAVLADRMDRQRFGALVKYLRELTLEDGTADMLALRNATRSAENCA